MGRAGVFLPNLFIRSSVEHHFDYVIVCSSSYMFYHFSYLLLTKVVKWCRVCYLVQLIHIQPGRGLKEATKPMMINNVIDTNGKTLEQFHINWRMLVLIQMRLVYVGLVARQKKKKKKPCSITTPLKNVLINECHTAITLSNDRVTSFSSMYMLN